MEHLSVEEVTKVEIEFDPEKPISRKFRGLPLDDARAEQARKTFEKQLKKHLEAIEALQAPTESSGSAIEVVGGAPGPSNVEATLFRYTPQAMEVDERRGSWERRNEALNDWIARKNLREAEEERARRLEAEATGQVVEISEGESRAQTPIPEGREKNKGKARATEAEHERRPTPYSRGERTVGDEPPEVDESFIGATESGIRGKKRGLDEVDDLYKSIHLRPRKKPTLTDDAGIATKVEEIYVAANKNVALALKEIVDRVSLEEDAELVGEIALQLQGLMEDSRLQLLEAVKPLVERGKRKYNVF